MANTTATTPVMRFLTLSGAHVAGMTSTSRTRWPGTPGSTWAATTAWTTARRVATRGTRLTRTPPCAAQSPRTPPTSSPSGCSVAP